MLSYIGNISFNQASEVFAIKDTVAFFKHFIPFGTQMKLLSKVTHIEEFFVVLLE